MKKLTLIASTFVICLTISQTAKAENKKGFYVGGGYQLNDISYNDSPVGSVTTNETIEVVDPSLTVIVNNPNGTTTTTTTTKLENVENTSSGAILDYNNYYPSKFDNFNLFFGAKLNKTIAAELGLFYQENEKDNNNSNQFLFNGSTTKNKSTLQIISLDAIASLPIIEKKLNMTPIAGISFVNLKTETNLFQNGVQSGSEDKNYNELGLNIGIGFELFMNDRFSIRTNVKAIYLPNSDIMKKIITSGINIKINI